MVYTVNMSNKLTIKQKKFVAEVVKDKTTKAQAYRNAGYKASTPQVASTESSKLLKKPAIQLAIDNALAKVGATPEFAVQVLFEVAQQDKEIGARRLASKDILELHGWNKSERPNTVLQINNPFFNVGSVVSNDDVIDV